MSKRDKLSAGRLLQSLEKIIGVPKGDWNGSLVRALWPPLEGAIASRKHSIEHEETWLILAGFLLRPGFGAPLDEARMDGLWRIRDARPCFRANGSNCRNTSSGAAWPAAFRVNARNACWRAELDRLRQQKSPPPELIRPGRIARTHRP